MKFKTNGQSGEVSATSRIMVLFAAIHSGIFDSLLKQCTESRQLGLSWSGLNTHHTNIEHQEPHKPLGRLQPFVSIAKVFNFGWLSGSVVWLCKYILLELVSHDGLPLPFENYQLLDCYWLGRFRFVGRTNKISSELVILFIAGFFWHRLMCTSLIGHTFRFHGLEFLLNDLKTVKGQNRPIVRVANVGSRRGLMRRETFAPGGASPAEDGFHVPLRPPAASQFAPSLGQNRNKLKSQLIGQPGHFDWQTQILRNSSPQFHQTESAGWWPYYLNPNLYFMNYFEPTEFLLRPNRSWQSWQELNRFTRRAAFISLVLAISWISVIFLTIGGSILTKLGYEMAYSTCVAHLRHYQLELGDESYHSNIYEAPQKLAYELKIDDIPALIPIYGPYKLQPFEGFARARILTDLLENFTMWLEFFCTFITLTFLMSFASLDVSLNASSIQQRLKQLLNVVELETSRRLDGRIEMEESDSKVSKRPIGALLEVRINRSIARRRFACSSSPRTSTTSSPERRADTQNRRHRHYSWAPITSQHHLLSEITRLQATLVDHFQLVSSYNAFVSKTGLLTPIVIWFSYTITICTWVSSTKSRVVETEFLITEIGGSVLILFMMGSAAMTRKQNSLLYPLITRLIALDCTGLVLTKLRWIKILEYYHPKPRFCFTVFGSSEVSWLFCLKVSD